MARPYVGNYFDFLAQKEAILQRVREYEDLSMQETIELRDPLVKRRLYKSSPEYRKKKERLLKYPETRGIKPKFLDTIQTSTETKKLENFWNGKEDPFTSKNMLINTNLWWKAQRMWSKVLRDLLNLSMFGKKDPGMFILMYLLKGDCL